MDDTAPELSAQSNMFAEKALAGQHAIVTGGSKGIGAACAAFLARMGANISLIARSQSDLDTKAREISAEHGVQVASATADVSKADDVAASFESVQGELGPAHILINNAGIGKSAPMHRMSLEIWEMTIGLNLTGTFLCTQQVYPAMREAGYGRIINISSTVGLRGYPYIAAYSSSKHGVVGFTRSLALECATKGITVNAVCPGYTDTDLVAEAVDNIVEKTGQSVDDVRAHLAGTSPIGRLITPDEVAETVAWLALPSSAAITGQSIVVSGGSVTN